MENIYVSIISNITFEPHFVLAFNEAFKTVDVHFKISSIPYEEHYSSEYQATIIKANMVIVCLNFETLFPDLFYNLSSNPQIITIKINEIITVCKKIYADISSSSNARILWFLFEDYFNKLHIVAGYPYNALVDKINAELSDTLKNDVSFINLKRLIAEVGIANTYDAKGKYRWNAPYSKVLIEAAVKEIHKQYLIEKGITKKCLVLDCDNVLWGGILSEDGIENIKLGGGGFGRSYQDFQRFALSLYYHGVILAICSKNDSSDVMMMFREHSEMILKEEHISCFQVNWENKPDSIKRIAETLNISLDSMVFVDDSPLEIAAVKAMLPEVAAIRYERDMSYEQFSCFNLKTNISLTDIEKRNETYRTNQFRETLKAEYNSYGEYIAALEIKMDIHEALPIEYSRIAELTQRTNKCTNGKRYTVAEIKERVARENVKLYSLSVSDHFSDLGLVGTVEVESNTLTLYSLSCRALGREIEDRLLEFIADKHQISKIEFKSTGKNADTKTLLNGFPNAVLVN
jgi:FkbH-like protein